MAVIINELEVVLEPDAGKTQPGGLTPPPEKPALIPHDLLTVLDREDYNRLRVLAH